ncbi:MULTISPECIES: hypothetical protein [Vibrio]|uniref:Lipoprotein n=4 Tax=Vibrio TaxID=662 RepID=A0AAN0W052_9VIBR|nr:MULTISPECIES: hypothetical protein [Vibrio]CAH1582481.1 conserved hypothetical protein [Vibrio jasicida]AIW22533.1 hypothetical protein IX92_26070 [Vibrio coralliilyticus]KIF53012.1 hypothetical protein H735_08665 [Vibrio owensii CAIM 1854 = LMG 25443]MCZ2802062.1 hypothetical protein [Vibrio alginolyticus]NOH36631.1 hypothetical protein [Vibrio coralliilyticus]
MKKLIAITAVALVLSACDNGPDKTSTASDSPATTVEQVEQNETTQAPKVKHVADEKTQNYVDELYAQADEHMKDVLSTIIRPYSALTESQKQNSKQVAINELHRDPKSGEWSAVIDFLNSEHSVKVPVNGFDSFLVNGVAYEIVKSEDGQLYAMQQGSN